MLSTAPSAEVAERLARTLLDEGLITCANLVPQVRSLYRWKGEVCDETEVLLVLKLPSAGFAALEARYPALHPYEVPELLRLDVTDGHRPYLDWVLQTASKVAATP